MLRDKQECSATRSNLDVTPPMTEHRKRPNYAEEDRQPNQQAKSNSPLAVPLTSSRLRCRNRYWIGGRHTWTFSQNQVDTIQNWLLPLRHGDDKRGHQMLPSVVIVINDLQTWCLSDRRQRKGVPSLLVRGWWEGVDRFIQIIFKSCCDWPKHADIYWQLEDMPATSTTDSSPIFQSNTDIRKLNLHTIFTKKIPYFAVSIFVFEVRDHLDKTMLLFSLSGLT